MSSKSEFPKRLVAGVVILGVTSFVLATNPPASMPADERTGFFVTLGVLALIGLTLSVLGLVAWQKRRDGDG